MGRVTLAQVAARAGVSQPTASRVLNGSGRRTSPEIVTAVREAAAELGYIPNAMAQALVRSSTGLMGLVVQDIADPYFSEIAAGVQKVARAKSRRVMLGVASRDPHYQLELVEGLISHGADAIVLAPHHIRGKEAGAADEQLDALLQRYRDFGTRVAVVGEPRPQAHAVVPSNREGSRQLADALVGQGHHRFLLLAGPQDQWGGSERRAGFQEGLARHGIEPLGVVHSPLNRDGGHRAMHEGFGLMPRDGAGPVCVFAVADVMALGAFAALREHGMRAPEEVCVAGFGDIPTLRDHHPGLTTVRLPLQYIGRRAAELALGGEEPAEDPVLEESGSQVLLRDSTALP